MRQGLEEMRQALPFLLQGIGSDNGSEFTTHLVRYCQAQQIQFTRGRPCKKDDNAQDWSKRFQVLVMFGWLQGLARAAGLNEDFGIRQAKSSSRRNTHTSRVVWVLCFG